MTRRLFWKTLAAFLTSYILIVPGVWLVLFLFNHHPPMRDDELARRVGPAVLEACAGAIEASGPSRCQTLLSGLAPDDQWRVRVEKTATRDPVTAPWATQLSRQVTDPVGRRWTISYAFSPPPPWPGSVDAPVALLGLGLIGGLVFSALYARHITEPMRRLRENVRELAEGRLGARVGQIEGRRDEIAGLGADFDRMAARLEALVADRDRLLHHVSHELRSPLSRMQMAIALAQKDPARVPALFERMKREIKRLNQIVSELLTLARAESDLRQSQQYFDLPEIVNSLISDATFEASEKNVTLRLDVSGDVEGPAIRGSAELIWRAIDNVLRNAIKFSPAGETISIALAIDRQVGRYTLVIQDRGPGIPPQTLPQVFDPFRKGGGRSDGFGLGLSIAQRAVEAHGGSIRADNDPAKGLRVTVSIPFVSPAAPSPSDQDALSSPADVRDGASTVLIRYVEHDGTEHGLRVRLGRNVMEVAVRNRVPGIVGECGGGCKCATCHVYVDPMWMAAVGAPSGVEQSMLDLTPARQPNSRLSCQIIVTEALDGLVVRMPKSQQ